MEIERGASIAAVVSRVWANLVGVRLFLRRTNHPEREIGGTDDSHLIFARLVAYEDPRGLWIELNTPEERENRTGKNLRLLVPWQHVHAIVLADEFSQSTKDNARQVGFGSDFS